MKLCFHTLLLPTPHLVHFRGKCRLFIFFSFNHEFFHVLNNENYYELDKVWVKLNKKGEKAYKFNAGLETIKAFAKGFEHLPIKKGFSSQYSYVGGSEEDRASIAEYLLNPFTAPSILRKCKRDTVLRNKVEMLTCCLFDKNKGNFKRNLSKKEYKEKFGFDNYEFYGKWSQNKKGIMLMDYVFWNKISKKG